MKKVKGKTKNIEQTIIGKFVTKNDILVTNKILFCTKNPILCFGIKALIVPSSIDIKTTLPVLYVDNENLPFDKNDIISIHKDGMVNVLWEEHSPHNALYVTDLCNSQCIMCPQQVEGLSRYDDCLKLLNLINFKNIENIGITGGEPTLEIDKLSQILKTIEGKKHNINVHILTNGRNFKKVENVNKLANVKNINLSYGIPLYSDIAEEHDYIVGKKGAFLETVQGLYNLAKYYQNIEIRIVILKQNYYKLKDIARYIYRNFPFVSHVALMGMEYRGNAETNYNLVAIDPVDYKQDLFLAIKEFVRYGMHIDIYNIPLCLVDNRIKNFCRDSISTWKKFYLPQCDNCKEKEICCGLFETSFKQSDNIKAFE